MDIFLPFAEQYNFISYDKCSTEHSVATQTREGDAEEGKYSYKIYDVKDAL